MDDVHSAGKVPYEKAPPQPELSVAELIVLYLHAFFDIFKVIVLSLIDLCNWVVSFIIPGGKKDIRGRLALITGGGNGLGREIALNLARLGCNIAIVEIDKVGGNDTVNDLSKLGVDAKFYLCDVSEPDLVNKTIEQIEIDMGPVDILVNNAGLMPQDSFREAPEPRDLIKIYQVNVFAHFWTIRALFDKMVARKRGHIVAISSMSAIHPMPGAVNYSSSKFAVAGFMRAFAEEVRQEGNGEYVKFTTAYPYFIPTRKDLTEAVCLRFPAVSVDCVARKVVNGILKDHREVVIPHFTLPMIQICAALLPRRVYDVHVRDHLLRERESKMFKTKEEKNKVT